MNSFRFIERGINAEIARQTEILEGGRARSSRRRCTSTRVPSAHHVAALQGGGARLPLLPRARPRPDRDHRGDARGAPARRCPSCPPRAPSASRPRLGARRGRRRLLAFAPELGDYFEARARPTATSTRPRSRTGCATSCAARRRRGPADRKVEPAALATLVALVAAKKVTQDAGKQVLDKLVAEGGDPARDRRGRGPGRDRRRRRALADRRRRARRQPRRRRARSAAAT